jgi:PGF-CTERM protein
MFRGNRHEISQYRRGFDMKKILVAMLIATMMLLALCSADDVTKTTSTTSATPGSDATKSTTTSTSSTPGPDATKSTTTTTSSTPATEPTSTTKSTTTTTATPGFEATFALTGILAVAFLALRRRS